MSQANIPALARQACVREEVASTRATCRSSSHGIAHAFSNGGDCCAELVVTEAIRGEAPF